MTTQPTPAQPQDQGWGEFYNGVFSDPSKLAFMMALGSSMTQAPRAGQGPLNQIAEGLIRGMGVMGLVAQQRQQREQQEQAQRIADEKLRLEREELGVRKDYYQGKTAQEKAELEERRRSNLAGESMAAQQLELERGRLGISQAQLGLQREQMAAALEKAKADAQTEQGKQRLEVFKARYDALDKVLGNALEVMEPEQFQQFYKDMVNNLTREGQALGVPGFDSMYTPEQQFEMFLKQGGGRTKLREPTEGPRKQLPPEPVTQPPAAAQAPAAQWTRPPTQMPVGPLGLEGQGPAYQGGPTASIPLPLPTMGAPPTGNQLAPGAAPIDRAIAEVLNKLANSPGDPTLLDTLTRLQLQKQAETVGQP